MINLREIRSSSNPIQYARYTRLTFFSCFIQGDRSEAVNVQAIVSARKRRLSWRRDTPRHYQPPHLHPRFSPCPVSEHGRECSFFLYTHKRVPDGKGLHGSRGIFLRKHGLRQDCRTSLLSANREGRRAHLSYLPVVHAKKTKTTVKGNTLHVVISWKRTWPINKVRKVFPILFFFQGVVSLVERKIHNRSNCNCINYVYLCIYN